MEDCIFCNIIKGEIPCIKIYEDEDFLAFLDVKPVNPGHALLIPKKHNDYLFDLADTEYTKLLLKAKELATVLQQKLQPKKVGLAVEGLSVPHIHIHLIPINNMGDLSPERATLVEVSELQAVAEKLK
jgi:histidine triad (HIT) family protein